MIAPGSFTPPPKVRSAVVRLVPLSQPIVEPHELGAFRVFVTACFSRRRKQLKNAVPELSSGELEELGIDPTLRPERLAPEAFIRMLRYRTQKTQ
jgi:16S rRNA (adenine1518-N6/adenine1519-N6)-dimethyltransferase